jgi:hypothetical protein
VPTAGFANANANDKDDPFPVPTQSRNKKLVISQLVRLIQFARAMMLETDPNHW